MSEGSEPRRRGGFLPYVLILFVVALGAVYAWKEIEMRGVRNEYDQKREEFEREQAMHDTLMRAKEGRLGVMLIEQSKELLFMAATGLGRAVDPDDIDVKSKPNQDFLLQLVKQRSVNRVVLVDTEGVIRYSSDQKLLGDKATKHFFGLSVESDRAQVQALQDELVLMVPVTDGRQLRATLITNFSKDVLTRRAGRAEAIEETEEPDDAG